MQQSNWLKCFLVHLMTGSLVTWQGQQSIYILQFLSVNGLFFFTLLDLLFIHEILTFSFLGPLSFAYLSYYFVVLVCFMSLFMSSLSLSLLCSVFSFCCDLVLLSSGIFLLPLSRQLDLVHLHFLVCSMSLSTSCVFKSSVFLCSLSCRCDIPSCCVYSCLLVCSSSSLLYVLFATYQVIKLSFITLWGIVYKYKNIVYFYSSLIKAKTRLNIQCAKKKKVFF